MLIAFAGIISWIIIGNRVGKLLRADAIKRTLAVSDQIAIYTMVSEGDRASHILTSPEAPPSPHLLSLAFCPPSHLPIFSTSVFRPSAFRLPPLSHPHHAMPKSATTSRAGGMRVAPRRGRGHLCWWPLIFKKNF